MNEKKETASNELKKENVLVEQERKIAPEDLRSKAGFAKTHGRPGPTPGY